MKNNSIIKDNSEELYGQIIDVFEDFLEEKGITLNNTEKEEDNGVNSEEIAIIYGSDYDNLRDSLEKIMMNWSKKNRKSLKMEELGTHSVKLTNKEISLIVEALDKRGDNIADVHGYSSGIPYWDLKEKLKKTLK